jgi:hypothetical protein
MLKLQVIPQTGVDAYKLLRNKVTNEARTWSWSNKAKTRLRHSRQNSGYIQVATAAGVLTAEIHPASDGPYFLTEKFIGRLIAWFPEDLLAINLQFAPESHRKQTKKKKL